MVEEKGVFDAARGALVLIPVDEIMPNKAQPRKEFESEALSVLAESIRKHGVLQPITVKRRRELSDYSIFKYELVAGERRLRASKIAGLGLIPALVLDVTDSESAELALIENLHREDLNIFEEAAAIASLMDLYDLTQVEVAEKLSLSQPAVANKLRLLRLSEAERRIILQNNLSERHARALLRVKDDEKRPLGTPREGAFEGER